MNILCMTPVDMDDVLATLRSCGNVYYYPNVTKSECRSVVRKLKPDALFVNPNKMGFVVDESILSGSSVKFISTASTGTNHIDMDYCKQNGIKVFSLTKEFDTINKISSTAEHAFALMLSLIRCVPQSFDSVKQYRWDYSNFIGRQLDHLSVGIIGRGRLGSMFERYCQAFSMKTQFYDPFVEGSVSSLEELVKSSDVISIHVHLNSDTRNMVDARLLSLANGLYLINTSRGEIVNEHDIIEMLRQGRLRGYATDVICDELSDVTKSPIISAASELNIIITPHIGGMTQEGRQIAYLRAAQFLKDCA